MNVSEKLRQSSGRDPPHHTRNQENRVARKLIFLLFKIRLFEIGRKQD